MIVPCDDGVVWQLHQIHRETPQLRGLIERSLGDPQQFGIVASRKDFLHVAIDLGVRVPKTLPIAETSDLTSWFSAGNEVAVLKLDGTWGGNGVIVARSLEDAREGLKQLMQPMPWSMAWKRLIVNRDPIALWNWKTRRTPSMTVQEFIPGRPANTMMACWEGEVLGMVTVEVLWSQGATGAATVVRLIDHPEISEAACLLARRLGLSGFHGLDFMLHPHTNAAYLLELNPRCTQLGHLPLAGQGTLAGRFIQALTGSPVLEPQGRTLKTGDVIAFYPQAFLWNPNSRYLAEGYHDIPRQAPELERELLKTSWPDRQLASRLYHWLRPPQREQAVAFEESPALAEEQPVQGSVSS